MVSTTHRGGERDGMKRTTLIVAAIALVTGLSACSNGSSKRAAPPAATSVPPTTAAAPTTSATRPRVQSGDRYVALGSSIASGYGIANQSTACGRSDRDYGRLVTAKLGLALTDVSCGGAVIPDVLDRSQGSAPPQIDAVTPDTKLITISIGGNDINLNGTAVACGDPATVCQAPATLASDEAALQGSLVEMLAQLKVKAPAATIVLVTYPREFPDQNCAALSLTDGELAMLRGMGEKLEAASIAAAQQAGVILVDPYAQPGDHTACASTTDRWTGGYHVAPGEGFAYHPTALGHEEMATLIEQALG
jgi:lysophospholipase L1-like esterase